MIFQKKILLKSIFIYVPPDHSEDRMFEKILV
jgi:hypothetical protein